MRETAEKPEIQRKTFDFHPIIVYNGNICWKRTQSGPADYNGRSDRQ
jgi:hypothetical protein